MRIPLWTHLKEQEQKIAELSKGLEDTEQLCKRTKAELLVTSNLIRVIIPPIQAILGFSRLLKDNPSDAESVAIGARAIGKAAERIQTLVEETWKNRSA
jgi:hypothetical protein